MKVLPVEKNKRDPLYTGSCEVLRHDHGVRHTVKTASGDAYVHMDMKTTGRNIYFLYYGPTVSPEDDTCVADKVVDNRVIKDNKQ